MKGDAQEHLGKGKLVMKWALIFFVFIASISLAQNPLGKVTNVQAVACPSGFAIGSSCQHLTISSCANTNDTGVTIGTKAAAGAKGTIVLFNGSNGTRPMSGPFVKDYSKFGFTVIDTMWDPPGWEGTGQAASILKGACRPATLLSYLSQNAKGAFCGQGHSAGSSALAYSMSHYGIDRLDHVELVSGPVMSDLEKGCENPLSAQVTVVPSNGAIFTNGPQYVNQFIAAVSHYTGQSCQPPTPTSETANAAWLAQSIVQPGAVLNFPNTGISGWLCDNGLNNSAAQGALFYSSLQSPYSLTRVSGCMGSEGVQMGTTPQAVKGQVAVEQDMEISCIARH
jgi:hypothetical protein